MRSPGVFRVATVYNSPAGLEAPAFYLVASRCLGPARVLRCCAVLCAFVGAHLLLEALPQLHDPLGVMLQGYIFLCFWLPAFDLDGRPLIIDRYKDDDAVGGFGVQVTFRVPRADVHRNVHASFTCVDELSVNFYHVTDGHRPAETDAANVDRDAVLPAPSGRAGIPSLIDPLHDRAAVYLASEVHIRRLGQES